MDVAPDSLGEGREQVRLGGLLARVLHNGLHLMVDCIQVLRGINVWDIPRVEDVVDVLQERLTLDLMEILDNHAPSRLLRYTL